MNWEAIGAVAESLGAIGVIASLHTWLYKSVPAINYEDLRQR